jgi:hypothetical protein
LPLLNGDSSAASFGSVPSISDQPWRGATWQIFSFPIPSCTRSQRATLPPTWVARLFGVVGHQSDSRSNRSDLSTPESLVRASLMRLGKRQTAQSTPLASVTL